MTTQDLEWLRAMMGHLRSVGEASRFIAKSPAWVRHLLETGGLRGVETPLGWLIDDQSLIEYAQQPRDARGRPRAAQRAVDALHPNGRAARGSTQDDWSISVDPA